MKWFQHLTDSNTNPKMKMLLREQGLEGYGFCWVCREIIGNYGKKYRLKAEKEWKTILQEVTKLPLERIEVLLEYQAEKKLIDRKALRQGDLYIPKMKEYSDDYTKRVRRRFGQGSDNVRQDKNRIDKNRIDKNRIDKNIKEKSIYPFNSKFMYVKKNFLESLKTTYKHINLQVEFSKMEGWLLANPGKRQRYHNWQKFIVNWLNRIEKPIERPKPPTEKPESTQKPDPKEQEKVATLIHKTVEKMNKK